MSSNEADTLHGDFNFALSTSKLNFWSPDHAISMLAAALCSMSTLATWKLATHVFRSSLAVTHYKVRMLQML